MWHLKWCTAIFLAPMFGIWHSVLMHLSAYVPAFRQPNGMNRDRFIDGNFCFLLLWTLKMSKNVMERPLLKLNCEKWCPFCGQFFFSFVANQPDIFQINPIVKKVKCEIIYNFQANVTSFTSSIHLNQKISQKSFGGPKEYPVTDRVTDPCHSKWKPHFKPGLVSSN